MSFKIDILTPNKKEISDILRSLANLIEKVSNRTIELSLDLTFAVQKKKEVA